MLTYSMFEVILFAVPQGGGKPEYQLPMKVPVLPREGDYISIQRNPMGTDDDMGSEDFIVRRVRWVFEYPDDGKTHHDAGQSPVGKTKEIQIECEFAVGPFSSEAHKRGQGAEARRF